MGLFTWRKTIIVATVWGDPPCDWASMLWFSRYVQGPPFQRRGVERDGAHLRAHGWQVLGDTVPSQLPLLHHLSQKAQVAQVVEKVT
jgi:hypothetical protein